VKLFEAMKHDKKVGEGVIKFVLVNKIGQVSFGQPVPLDLVEKVLDESELVPTPAQSGPTTETVENSAIRNPQSAI
jgi:hypothetical protein